MVYYRMRYELTKQLQGSPHSYWMLRVFNPDNSVRMVHTSNTFGYIQKILKRYTENN